MVLLLLLNLLFLILLLLRVGLPGVGVSWRLAVAAGRSFAGLQAFWAEAALGAFLPWTFTTPSTSDSRALDFKHLE